MSNATRQKAKGQFEVSTVGTLLQKGKKAGPGVVPGKPEESAIVQYIRGQKEPQMPKGNPPLSEAELHLVRLWILGGAQDDSEEFAAAAKQKSASSKDRDAKALSALGQDKSSRRLINAALFSENNEQLMILRRNLRLAQLPAPPQPPKVEAPVFNPIDQFVVAKWKEAGLKEATRAPELCDDATFMRRVYLD
jgi:hypothetical protein